MGGRRRKGSDGDGGVRVHVILPPHCRQQHKGGAADAGDGCERRRGHVRRGGMRQSVEHIQALWRSARRACAERSSLPADARTAWRWRKTNEAKALTRAVLADTESSTGTSSALATETPGASPAKTCGRDPRTDKSAGGGELELHRLRKCANAPLTVRCRPPSTEAGGAR